MANENEQPPEVSTEGDLKTLSFPDISQCVHAMAQAFCDSPAYKFIFQGTEEHRIQALEWLFDMNLHLMLQKSPECLRGIVNPDGTIICCFMWVPATAAKLTPWELVKAGLWQIPFRFGFATMSRLVSLLNAMEAAMGNVKDEDGNTTCEDFAMLQRMVVLPSCQGKGVGSRALRAILKEHCATTTNNLSIHLETQEEPNVRFYQRLGWEVSGGQDHFEDDPEYKFHSWQMVHPGTMPASS